MEKVIVYARRAFPNKPLILGCMRPYGDYRRELDQLAVRAGVNRIVNPTRAAPELARAMGMTVRAAEECCVVSLMRRGKPTCLPLQVRVCLQESLPYRRE